ncbi:MAG: hypothetical protein AB7S56_06055 [Halothiobacillaceae bacterium]
MRRLFLLFLLACLPVLTHAEIRVNASLSNTTPWVREEVLLTIEVVDDRSIIEQTTAPWTPSGLSLRPLNPSEERIQTPEGLRILRRQHWALMPLYAGNITLQPPSIELRLSGQGRISLTPNALQLKVRPLNPLLPADVPVSMLQLKLAPPPEAVPRGRPFNINFNIQGSGLTTRGLRHWLDESLRSSGDLRIYPPEVRLVDNIDPTQPLKQQAEVRLTFESQTSGKLQLPSITLPFVNPSTGDIQHATLPSTTLTVEHPLWIALRPWLPWTLGATAFILLLIGTWPFAQQGITSWKQRRKCLKALQAAQSPKALRSAWKAAAPRHLSDMEALNARLDAACYGVEVLNDKAFNTLKDELIQRLKTR